MQLICTGVYISIVSLKSKAALLFSERPVPFPDFLTWCEERSPCQKVVEFDGLAGLGLSRNCQKIPSENVPDEEYLVVLRLFFFLRFGRFALGTVLTIE